MRRNGRQVLNSRFCGLVNDWLATLDGGWRGTSAELAAELSRFRQRGHRHGVYVVGSKGIGRSMEMAKPVLDAAGYRLTFARTAKERTIELTRADGMKGTKRKPGDKAPSPPKRKRTPRPPAALNCATCGQPTSVKFTRKGERGTLRWRVCPCGEERGSTETWDVPSTNVCDVHTAVQSAISLLQAIPDFATPALTYTRGTNDDVRN